MMPMSFEIILPGAIPSRFDNHIERRLSSMRGMFLDEQAFQEMLDQDDLLMYEVYEMKRPELQGELISGISIVHPGKVGREFFMTKGHFHRELETGEIYYCLQGAGCMVMETPEGDHCVEELRPGRVLYVPPRWAHRSVCSSRQVDLITFFVYPGNAGHDYGTIEQLGFRKLVLDGEQGIEIIDNPRYQGR
jgi:glucose-6-phosphate isomerase